VLAARGRKVVLRIAETETLSVFDLVGGKILKQIPRGGEKWRIAAGRDVLILVNAETANIEWWSLDSLEQIETGKLDMPTPIGAIAMGSGSQGPLLVTPGEGHSDNPLDDIKFFDAKTLKLAHDHIAPTGRFGIPSVTWGELMSVTASTDGKTFCLPLAECLLRLVGDSVAAQYVDMFHNRGKTLIPGPAGEYLYGKWLPMDTSLKLLPTQRQDFQAGEYTRPDADGPFYLQMPRRGLAIAGSDTFIATLPLTAPRLGARVNGRYLPVVTHLVSGANLAFSLVEANRTLELVRFDLERILQRARRPFVVVLSRPETTAQAGTAFRYQIRSATNGGNVEYSLEFGPTGMTVSPEGLVTWNVPRRLRDAHPNVVIRVTSGADRWTFHRFSLDVTGATIDPKADPAAHVSASAGKIPDPMRLTPFPLQQPSAEARLAAIVDDTLIGGGGRFLLLRMNSINKLAVFDVTQAAVIGYLPLPSAGALVTAGANCIIVVQRDQVQRWNLADLSFDRGETLELPKTQEPQWPRRANEGVPTEPQELSPTCVAMGSASEGPILVGFPPRSRLRQEDAPIVFLDGATLGPLDTQVVGQVNRPPSYNSVRVSPNGSVLTVWNSSTSPDGVQLYVDQGDEFEARYIHESRGSLFPTADGRYILGHGVITNRIRPAGFRAAGFSVPAVRGPYFLSIERNRDDVRRAGYGQPRDNSETVSVCAIGDGRPLAEIELLEPLAHRDDRSGGPPRELDKWIWLIPDANLIIQLSPTCNRLILYRFDINQALADYLYSYLFYESSPPLIARAGTEWSYRPKRRSKNGGTKLRIPIAPDGMKLSNDGTLTWQASRKDADRSQQVTIIATDSQGDEAQQTFHITVY